MKGKMHHYAGKGMKSGGSGASAAKRGTKGHGYSKRTAPNSSKRTMGKMAHMGMKGYK